MSLLAMQGIDKSYPGVHALRGVELALERGEVLALLGENGAGKSTLIKVLAGAVVPERGSIRIDERDVVIRNPLDARRAGVAVIYQELNLVPTLTAAENIFLGQELARFGWVRRRREQAEARRLFERLGVTVDPAARCRDLSVAQQQAVEIAKALAQDARILVLDEPTATLTPQEVERLFAVIRELKAQGIGLIYISHRLDEIDAIADRTLVLRDGALVGTRRRGEFERGELIEMMVGRRLEQEFPRRQLPLGETRLMVSNLCSTRLRIRAVSFAIRRGEVLGLTGLVGAGRTETARLLFGAERPDSGTIALDGRTLTLRSPRDAIRHGICLLTEDRKLQGLILGQSVRSNFALPNLARFARLGFVAARRESGAFAPYATALRIRLPSVETPARNLSGGNQQKVVLAKWLEANAEVMIFDEPTRGIDVGAKAEIYQLINGLAARGKAILLISSELPEVLGMCDRILVMRAGRIAAEITKTANTTEADVLRAAV